MEMELESRRQTAVFGGGGGWSTEGWYKGGTTVTEEYNIHCEFHWYASIKLGKLAIQIS